MFPTPYRRTRLALLSFSAAVACTGQADARKQQSGTTTTPAISASPDTSDPRVKRADLARIMGDSSANVWMIIASDFQCPYCKFWHDSVSGAIVRDYVATKKIRVAYVNYPIRSHMNAIPSAEAAMCAGAQGKFWEYGDRLFATQQQWEKMPVPQIVFARLGAELGIDSAAFLSCLADHVMVPMIMADQQRGNAAGVDATPAFIIGKRVFLGAKPLDVLKPALDSAIAEAKGSAN